MDIGNTMVCHRTGERRRHSNTTSFPLSDSQCVLVLENRHVQPDRRLGNIGAECIDISLSASQSKWPEPQQVSDRQWAWGL